MNQLSPQLMLGLIAAYFFVLIITSFFTSRNADNQDFFLGGRKSHWLLIAFGMIGSSLSGVTFISIPGAVGATPELMQELTGVATVKPNIQFSYMQIVFGYLLGYAVIALVLLPLYYKMNLTSIYTYLESRLGIGAYKTGAAFFLLSRLIGASFRLYLVAIILQRFIMDAYDIPFFVTVAVTILLIWVYTFKGGIKTIIWTDTFQTFSMLLAVVLTIYFIGQTMGKNVGELAGMISNSEYSKIFFFESGWSDPNNFFKQFISGALITIVMTGLDQDMMQKNLSCRNLRDAQKNMFTFSFTLVFVNFLFLSLGVLLYLYADFIQIQVPLRTDELYPMLALQHLPAVIGIAFVIGLIAAAYSSADSALTALTTSFCIDFLNFERATRAESQQKQLRLFVHIGFSILFLLSILLFNAINNDSVINKLFQIAGYTYGPLLGLFAFGMFTKRMVTNQALVVIICVAAPIISYFLEMWGNKQGLTLGFMVLALNGLLTFTGLWAISSSKTLQTQV